MKRVKRPRLTEQERLAIQADTQEIEAERANTLETIHQQWRDK